MCEQCNIMGLSSTADVFVVVVEVLEYCPHERPTGAIDFPIQVKLQIITSEQNVRMKKAN